VPEHFNLPWHLAIESADAGRCGAGVDWTDYAAGTGAMLADLGSGRLDLAVLLTEGAALGIARALPVVAVSLYTTSPLIWGVHVPPDSRYARIADLRGARFAISREGSGSHLMSLAMANRHGWPVAGLDYEIVDDLAGAIEAFRQGRAEVFLWEHFTTEPAVAAGHFRRIDDFVAPWPAWVVCAHEPAWQRHRQPIESLIAIVAASAAGLATAPDRVTTIARRYGLEPAAVEQWLGKTQWASEPSSPALALAAARRMLHQAGAIQ
jgi:ABC-type nitrate/sulfonate/bicarbonate transport system substrate-binding protein